MAAKIIVDTSVLVKWIKTKNEQYCPLITADGPFFNRTRSLPRVRHLSKIGRL